jgi:hypothetical protein
MRFIKVLKYVSENTYFFKLNTLLFKMIRGPDFYGFWESEAETGIFFMDILENERDRIKGTLVDKFGIADFSGKLRGDRISFDKSYNHQAIKRGGATQIIHYDATAMNEYFYEGKWKVKGLPVDEGGFMLQAFPLSQTLFKVYKELLAKS